MTYRQPGRALVFVLPILVFGWSGCGSGVSDSTPDSADPSSAANPPPACPGAVDCFPGATATVCQGITFEKVTLPFDPNDPRWAANYRTCLGTWKDYFRPTECDWFCEAVVSTHAFQHLASFGLSSVDCSHPDHPAIDVQYTQGHCDPPRPGPVDAAPGSDGR